MTGMLSILLFTQLAVAMADRVIAESDHGKLLYSMIGCGSAYRDRPDSCHRLEQQRIDTRLHRQWVDAAQKLYAIVLTPEEEADVDNRVSAEHSLTQKAAERFRALAIAAVRIRRGEDRAIVAADLSRQGISAQELDWELEQLPTLAAAERTAVKDFVADGEKAAREYYTRRYVLDHLTKIVQRRAAGRHIAFEVAEEQFWSEIVRKTHTRVVHPSYRLPALKGVLVSHEQQSQIAH